MADDADRRIDGRTALVTGASSGIGRAIAVALAARGAAVCVVGRHRDRLADTTSAARAHGVTVLPAIADLTGTGRAEELAELLDREFGELDVLVHSAGIYARGDFAESAVEELDALYQINVRAPYRLTQAVLPMLLRSRGDVVFVNSTHGWSAYGRPTRGGLAQYAASQHAVKAMADNLRAEVNPSAVRVTTIHLGRTATPMQERIFAAEGREYPYDALIQPQDVAELVISAIVLPKRSQLTSLTLWPTRPT